MVSDEWVLKRWTERDFHNNKVLWDTLLEHSGADPLFLSWSWMNQWWQEHKTPQCTLCIFALYSGNILLGVAPLYIERDTYARGILQTRRLQFIGKRLSYSSGIRSEYMDFIVHQGYEQPVMVRLLDAIAREPSWSELALFDVDENSSLNKALQAWPAARAYHKRHEQAGPTYVVDCRKRFADYLASLGSATRLKLYNRRKVLEQQGKVELVILTEDTWQTLIDSLLRWHQGRWSRCVFGKNDMAFLLEVTTMNALHGSSLLMLDGVPVSVMVNVRAGTTVYNIQLAFKDDLDKRISMGTLHLGYVIEQMFLDPAVDRFDLLIGTGKHSNYKSHIANQGPMLVSNRWIRRRPLKWVFQLYDAMFAPDARHYPVKAGAL